MKIPKKISPDRIKDSIVEIRYSSNLPYEVIIGLLFQSLDESYTYTNRPLGKQLLSAASPNNLQQEITLSLGGQILFYNDKIKIQLLPQSIIFNCLSNYIGWASYRVEIEKALAQFSKANVFLEYNRLGVRYISEYVKTDLKDCVKFSFTFGMPNISSESYTFNSQFKYKDYRVILNLNNRIPVINQTIQNQSIITPVSLIDIDVILENIKIDTFPELVVRLDEAHSGEKEIFFNLLKEEFLSSLNPEY
jgi:uncharacterized protein (TIGR04255 family)